MAAVEQSADKVVRVFRHVPETAVKVMVEDFVSEGFAVEQIRESDGTYTVRAQANSRASKKSSAS
jgi:hypothetical protein